ncbi:hypothetical protein D3C87_1782550 [compost metagenome]
MTGVAQRQNAIGAARVSKIHNATSGRASNNFKVSSQHAGFVIIHFVVSSRNAVRPQIEKHIKRRTSPQRMDVLNLMNATPFPVINISSGHFCQLADGVAEGLGDQSRARLLLPPWGLGILKNSFIEDPSVRQI